MKTTTPEVSDKPLPSTLFLSEQEARFRRNRWKRRYPSFDAWLAAHPGECVGRVIEAPPITYYMGEVFGGSGRPKKPGACWTTPGGQPPPKDAKILTEAEFREWWGMPPRAENPPKYKPATPDNWDEKPLPSKAECIKRVRAYAAKYGVTLTDLTGELVPSSNGNGQAKSKVDEPTRWQRINGRYYKVPS